MAKFSATLDYTNIDGNAFSVMGAVAKAIRKSGGTEADVKEYQDAAMSGDYNNLLRVSMEYIGMSQEYDDEYDDTEDDYCGDCGEYLNDCDCY